MDVGFEKWHGCKNDFLVVWVKPTEDEIVNVLKRHAVRICSRDGEGIGADGILILHQNTPDDLQPSQMTIINSDASIAKNCGNGLRCAAQSILKRTLEVGHKQDIPEGVEIEVEGHRFPCRFLGRARTTERSRNLPMIAVEIGVPTLGNEVSFAQEFDKVLSEKRHQMKTQLPANYELVEVGNPHVVFQFHEVNRQMIEDIGPLLQEGWDGINVHIIAPKELSDEDRSLASNKLGQGIEELFEVWTWERGAGLTQACGSGASAVAVSQFATGLSSRDSWMAIDMPGGRLYCKQDEEDDPVILAGPAEYVAKGFLDL